MDGFVVYCGMKIIAKEKDYYDYLQGVYGVDEKLVYDRRNGHALQFFEKKNGKVFYVFVNGKSYCAVYYNGKFRYDFESIVKTYEEYLVIRNLNSNCWSSSWSIDLWSQLNSFDWKLGNQISKRVEDLIKPINSDINKKLRQPVLVSEKKYPKENQAHIPLTLKQFDFGGKLNAQDVYIEISNFLGWCADNPPIPDKQTDKEKVLSHGFDLKTSFRHRK